MKGVLVDSDVILDIFLDNPAWAEWSLETLGEYGSRTTLYINAVVYAELSMGFEKIEDLEWAIGRGGFKMLEIPKEALFLAGKAFLEVPSAKGSQAITSAGFFCRRPRRDSRNTIDYPECGQLSEFPSDGQAHQP